MNARTLTQLIVVFAILIAAIASPGSARAWSKCPAYVTVQWGDTLGGLALLCDTTVDAIRAANPGLGYYLYAGQVLYIPSGFTPAPPPAYGTYVVQRGDTLRKIAAKYGTSVNDLLTANPQIYNPNLIYAGQVINLPGGISVPPTYPPPTYPPPPPADTYSTLKIAYKYGMLIRNAPNGSFVVSALDKTVWKYRSGSTFIDSKGRLWVEVKISPATKGYSTGWLLVKDQFGTYFTEPQIDR